MPEADTTGLTPSAEPGTVDDAISEKARRAAAQAWVMQLDMGFSVVVKAQLRADIIASGEGWLKCRSGIGSMAGGYEAWAGAAPVVGRISSRMASSPPNASAAPIPSTQAVQPRRSKT